MSTPNDEAAPTTTSITSNGSTHLISSHALATYQPPVAATAPSCDPTATPSIDLLPPSPPAEQSAVTTSSSSSQATHEASTSSSTRSPPAVAASSSSSIPRKGPISPNAPPLSALTLFHQRSPAQIPASNSAPVSPMMSASSRLASCGTDMSEMAPSVSSDGSSGNGCVQPHPLPESVHGITAQQAAEHMVRPMSSSSLAEMDTTDLDQRIEEFHEQLRLRSALPKSPPMAASAAEQAAASSSSAAVRRVAEQQVRPSDFKVLRLLGKGDVGRVYLVMMRKTGELFAMKMLRKKDMLARNKVHRLLTEWEVLVKTDHPFLSTLYYSFQSKTKLYFVMEYCAGGEFFHFLRKQPNCRLSERHTQFYAAEVLIALEYLHMNDFVYRDIKPENILIHETGHLRLTDFDLSKRSAAQSLKMTQVGDQYEISTGANNFPRFNSFVGTVEYLAPEIVSDQGHNAAVDWWGYGVLIYEMLYGCTPFKGSSHSETFHNILNKGLKFPAAPKVSSTVKDLITRLLHPNPSKRLGSKNGAADVRAHRWFRDVNFAMIRNLEPPWIPVLQSPFDTSHFRKYHPNDLMDDPLSDDEPISASKTEAAYLAQMKENISATMKAEGKIGGEDNPFRAFQYYASQSRGRSYGLEIRRVRQPTDSPVLPASAPVSPTNRARQQQQQQQQQLLHAAAVAGAASGATNPKSSHSTTKTSGGITALGTTSTSSRGSGYSATMKHVRSILSFSPPPSPSAFIKRPTPVLQHPSTGSWAGPPDKPSPPLSDASSPGLGPTKHPGGVGSGGGSQAGGSGTNSPRVTDALSPTIRPESPGRSGSFLANFFKRRSSGKQDLQDSPRSTPRTPTSILGTLSPNPPPRATQSSFSSGAVSPTPPRTPTLKTVTNPMLSIPSLPSTNSQIAFNPSMSDHPHTHHSSHSPQGTFMTGHAAVAAHQLLPNSGSGSATGSGTSTPRMMSHLAL